MLYLCKNIIIIKIVCHDYDVFQTINRIIYYDTHFSFGKSKWQYNINNNIFLKCNNCVIDYIDQYNFYNNIAEYNY